MRLSRAMLLKFNYTCKKHRQSLHLTLAATLASYGWNHRKSLATNIPSKLKHFANSPHMHAACLDKHNQPVYVPVR